MRNTTFNRKQNYLPIKPIRKLWKYNVSTLFKKKESRINNNNIFFNSTCCSPVAQGLGNKSSNHRRSPMDQGLEITLMNHLMLPLLLLLLWSQCWLFGNEKTEFPNSRCYFQKIISCMLVWTIIEKIIYGISTVYKGTF